MEWIALGHNRLSGSIPASGAYLRLPYDVWGLESNMFNDVAEGLCAESRGTDFETHGCAAFLCYPATYQPGRGRAEGNTPCMDCPSALYWGSTSCSIGDDDSVDDDDGIPTLPPVVPRLTDEEILIKIFEETGGSTWTVKTGWTDAVVGVDDDDVSSSFQKDYFPGTDNGNRNPNDPDEYGSDGRFCTWFGVQCTSAGDDDFEDDDDEATKGSYRVKSLHLGSNRLRGSLPLEIFMLRKMVLLVPYLGKYDDDNDDDDDDNDDDDKEEKDSIVGYWRRRLAERLVKGEIDSSKFLKEKK